MTDPADKDSVLTSTKKMLGIAKEYTAFDLDILMHINSVMGTLWQLGVGTEADQYEVDDETTVWATILGTQKNLIMIKSYVFLRVKMLFDPPSTGFTSQSYDNQIAQLEWRISVAASSAPNTTV